MAEYIEREKLQKKINRIVDVYDLWMDRAWFTPCGINALIEEIPAADVRPVVRGKWIEHNYDPEYLSCDFSCSECNVYLEEYYFGEGQWPGKTDHYFCPNCGADMRTGAE